MSPVNLGLLCPLGREFVFSQVARFHHPCRHSEIHTGVTKLTHRPLDSTEVCKESAPTKQQDNCADPRNSWRKLEVADQCSSSFQQRTQGLNPHPYQYLLCSTRDPAR